MTSPGVKNKLSIPVIVASQKIGLNDFIYILTGTLVKIMREKENAIKMPYCKGDETIKTTIIKINISTSFMRGSNLWTKLLLGKYCPNVMSLNNSYSPFLTIY